jgi:8-oxo-dGTP pyrophosphatase MutT (NUDIX family)
MYKVFYNNSCIEVGGKLTKGETVLQVVQLLNKTQMHHFLDGFVKTENPRDCRLGGYAEAEMFEDLKSYFRFVEAAGGLVMNSRKEYLFIKRFGIWDLPKGKMKQNEAPGDAAIREVEEETGVSGLTITEKLPATYHIYAFKNNFVLKKTYWYLMFATGKGKPVPQLEEDITEAVWLDKAQSEPAIRSSYRSLRENFLVFFQD